MLPTHISNKLGNGHAQGVFAATLGQTYDGVEQTSGAHSFLDEENDANHLRSTVGQGTRLVEHNNLDLRGQKEYKL